MSTPYVTGLSDPKKAIFEANKERLEEIFNEEGLTMRGVTEDGGKLLISAVPMNQDAINSRLVRKIKEDLGIGITVCL